MTVLAVACNNVVALRPAPSRLCKLSQAFVDVFEASGSEGKSLFDSLKRINVASKDDSTVSSYFGKARGPSPGRKV